MLGSYKHSSLSRILKNYRRKKLYNFGPRTPDSTGIMLGTNVIKLFLLLLTLQMELVLIRLDEKRFVLYFVKSFLNGQL